MPKDKNKSNEYWCECEAICHGQRHQLSRSAWYKHNPKNEDTVRSKQVQRGVREERRLEAKVAKEMDKGRPKTSRKGKERDVGADLTQPFCRPLLIYSERLLLLVLLGNMSYSLSPSNMIWNLLDYLDEYDDFNQQDEQMDTSPNDNRQTLGDEPYTPASAASHRASERHSAAPVDIEDLEELVEINFDIPGGDNNTSMDKNCKMSLQFINLLRDAKLEDSGLTEEDIHLLENPHSRVLPGLDNNPWLSYALKLFVTLRNSPINLYNTIRKAAIETFPDIHFPSHSEISTLVNNVSGVTPIFHDMCRNSCLAFTGPFEGLDDCPECGVSRWKDPLAKKRVAEKQTLTLPIGSSIQALYAGQDSAAAMQYRVDRTKELFAEFAAANNSSFETGFLDDFLSGEGYLKATQDGRIDATDTLLLFSIDGAQLYRDRPSDVWIYIWVIMDLAPDKRYKKKYVIPGGIIPGPSKPKNLESFIFPGLYHIAALQNRPGNLRIYDAHQNEERSTCPKIVLATADTLGMTAICGSTGHTGARGCRKSCGQKGRRQAGKGTYYPVLKLPDRYQVVGCDFPDIDLATRKPPSQIHYNKSINTILSTRAGNPHRKARKEAGFSRPSIFLGVNSPFGVPALFPLDNMHLFALNLPELFLALWCRQLDVIKCRPGDDVNTWDWATLVGDAWTTHGKQVAAFRKFLPSSYERPPRNPAEKINSGYKASEFLVYFYGYLPILLPGILPQKYVTHFYKLVRAVRLFLQASITREQLQEARDLAMQFVEEYEDLYVQRNPDRIHLVRPCLHVFSHVADEIAKLGPLRIFAQWTMERMVGILEGNLNLHSNPFSNMQQIAIRYLSTNTLVARMPELQVENSLLDTKPMPSWSFNAGHGYRLLHPHDRSLTFQMPSGELAAFQHYFSCDCEKVFVRRSSRLEIPQVHIARSRFWEGTNNKTTSRFVKIVQGTETFFAEVLYYFQTHASFIDIGVNEPDPVTVECGAFAMVSLLSDPDPALLQESFNVLCVSYHEPDTALAVFPVHLIRSTVAALPYRFTDNYFYILEELGLDVSQWTGSGNSTQGLDDDDEQSVYGEEERPEPRPRDFDGSDSDGVPSFAQSAQDWSGPLWNAAFYLGNHSSKKMLESQDASMTRPKGLLTPSSSFEGSSQPSLPAPESQTQPDSQSFSQIQVPFHELLLPESQTQPDLQSPSQLSLSFSNNNQFHQVSNINTAQQTQFLAQGQSQSQLSVQSPMLDINTLHAHVPNEYRDECRRVYMLNETLLIASRNSLILKWHNAWQQISTYGPLIAELRSSNRELRATLAAKSHDLDALTLRVKAINNSEFILREPAPPPNPPEDKSLIKKLWFYEKQWLVYKKEKKEERAKEGAGEKGKGTKGKRKVNDIDDDDEDDNDDDEGSKKKNPLRNTLYIVNADGNPVPFHTASEMRDTLKSILGELKTCGRLKSASRIGRPAVSFQDLLDSDVRHVIARLEADYPELTIGDRHWKARCLASDNFGHWLTKVTKAALEDNAPPTKRVKLEVREGSIKLNLVFSISGVYFILLRRAPKALAPPPRPQAPAPPPRPQAPAPPSRPQAPAPQRPSTSSASDTGGPSHPKPQPVQKSSGLAQLPPSIMNDTLSDPSGILRASSSQAQRGNPPTQTGLSSDSYASTGKQLNTKPSKSVTFMPDTMAPDTLAHNTTENGYDNETNFDMQTDSSNILTDTPGSSLPKDAEPYFEQSQDPSAMDVDNSQDFASPVTTQDYDAGISQEVDETQVIPSSQTQPYDLPTPPDNFNSDVDNFSPAFVSRRAKERFLASKAMSTKNGINKPYRARITNHYDADSIRALAGQHYKKLGNKGTHRDFAVCYSLLLRCLSSNGLLTWWPSRSDLGFRTASDYYVTAQFILYYNLAAMATSTTHGHYFQYQPILVQWTGDFVKIRRSRGQEQAEGRSGWRERVAGVGGSALGRQRIGMDGLR
ncbi:hypothetical protein NP233_g1017 [Leucocoprinus birnbaumii]|uniref:Uncharacterized protein n=1 Tax=Leucocoprinus birnbaumii TaxID=56174 RepID=A0AAD5YV88_9AGAR|nr:hypothetical protein NP233_g1017 [Leucocoprinus birnbaumii]